MLRNVLSASLMVLFAVGGTASAQSKAAAGRTVVPSVIVEQPRGDAYVVEAVPPGVVIDVLGQRGDWYQVSLLNAPEGPARPVGWMHRQAVELLRGQSVPYIPVAGSREVSEQRSPSPQGGAAEFEPLAPNRGWVDVNFISMRSRQEEQSHSLTTVKFGEIAAAASVYPALPDLRGLEAAAGVQLARTFGLGVHVDIADYESAVGLGVSVPHPYYFNRSVVDADIATLERQDRAIDINATYIAPMPSAVAVRLFVGPTYFYTSQEMVRGIVYDQFATIFSTAQIVDITSASRDRVTGSAWGFNAGADVSYFFSRYVGFGGVARVNHGTLKVEDPLSGDETDIALGAFTVGGGIRLRF